MTLEEFLLSPARSAWLSEPGINVYVRKALRPVDGARVRCLDVANIEVPGPLQKSGIFSRWLLNAEALARGEYGCVMVENVLNEHLPAYLLRNGYIERFDIPTCYIKRL